MVYSNTVRDHFACPRNVGELKNPTAVGRAKNEADGDQVQIHLRIKDGKITDLWQNYDQLGFMQQMGAIPTPE